MNLQRKEHLMKRSFLLVFFIFICLSCGQNHQSTLSGLGYSNAGKNWAVILGSPNGLPGVPTDVRELNKLLLEERFGFGFKTLTHAKAKVADVEKLTSQAAKVADTLFWHFSGHGASGYFMTESGNMYFKEVLDLIYEAREQKPLKRLIILLDTCEAGHIINGNIPVIGDRDPDEEDDGDIDDDERRALLGPKSRCMSLDQAEQLKTGIFDVMAKGFENKVFEQGFVFAASQKNQTSEDVSAEAGGAFTYCFRNAVAKLFQENKNATFKDVADETITTTLEYNQRPLYRAFPEDLILRETMFKY